MASQQITEFDALYLGRNSIGDEGDVWYRLADCPEVSTDALRAAFNRGVRQVRAENRLNADTEWDEDLAA